MASGGEAVVHAWRDVMTRLSGDERACGVKVDLTNAFNQIHRDVFLRECESVLPDIYRLVRFLYGDVSHLRAFGEWVDSEEGTHQGCPLGSLLFCPCMFLCPALGGRQHVLPF